MIYFLKFISFIPILQVSNKMKSRRHETLKCFFVWIHIYECFHFFNSIFLIILLFFGSSFRKSKIRKLNLGFEQWGACFTMLFFYFFLYCASLNLNKTAIQWTIQITDYIDAVIFIFPIFGFNIIVLNLNYVAFFGKHTSKLFLN